MARRDSVWQRGRRRPQTGLGELRPGEGVAIGTDNPGVPGLFTGARQKSGQATRGRRGAAILAAFRPNLNPVGVDLGQTPKRARSGPASLFTRRKG